MCYVWQSKKGNSLYEWIEHGGEPVKEGQNFFHFQGINRE